MPLMLYFRLCSPTAVLLFVQRNICIRSVLHLSVTVFRYVTLGPDADEFLGPYQACFDWS